VKTPEPSDTKSGPILPGCLPQYVLNPDDIR
jgi:hypothetical protein